VLQTRRPLRILVPLLSPVSKGNICILSEIFDKLYERKDEGSVGHFGETAFLLTCKDRCSTFNRPAAQAILVRSARVLCMIEGGLEIKNPTSSRFNEEILKSVFRTW
jgi:hypothetical protein